MSGHMWGDCPDEDWMLKRIREGCPRESDYPEKDGWRDRGGIPQTVAELDRCVGRGEKTTGVLIYIEETKEGGEATEGRAL